jgi:DNA-binding XRE family transcriptional regulator
MPKAQEPPLEQQIEDLSREVDRLREILADYSTVRRPGRPEGGAWERAETALEVIQELNTMLPLEQRWAVNQSLLNTYLGVVREVAKRLLIDRKAEIDAINHALPLPPHRQNLGNDFYGLRQQLDKRLNQKRMERKQAGIDPELMQQFADLLERSKAEPQIHDPTASNLLRQIREAKGLTQRAIGQQINQPQSVIAALEGGKRTLTRNLLLRYAHWINSALLLD